MQRLQTLAILLNTNYSFIYQIVFLPIFLASLEHLIAAMGFELPPEEPSLAELALQGVVLALKGEV